MNRRPRREKTINLTAQDNLVKDADVPLKDTTSTVGCRLVLDSEANPQQESAPVKEYCLQETNTSEMADEAAGSRMVRRCLFLSYRFIDCHFGPEERTLEDLQIQ